MNTAEYLLYTYYDSNHKTLLDKPQVISIQVVTEGNKLMNECNLKRGINCSGIFRVL